MRVKPFLWLALSFFGYYCAYGVFIPFFPAWLKAQNYGEELIGLVIACSYFFRFIGGIFFAGLITHASQLLNALRGLAWASVGVMLLIGFSGENFWLLFAAIALFSMINSAGMPITDTLATTWQQQIRLNYGKARLIGSAAFVVGVVVFGNLIGLLGNQKIIWILTALLLAYALVQMLSPSPAPLNAPESATKESVTFIKLLKNQTTLRILLAATLLQASHAGYYAYSVLYWTSQGITLEAAGLLWGLAVAAEILLFFCSARLLRNWTISALLYTALIAAAIRWALFGVTSEVWLIALLQCLHSLTFAMMHYAVMRYISKQPQNTMAKLQSLYNGLASCAGVGLMTAVAGQLYPISGQLMFMVMTAVALIALIIVPPKSPL